MFRLYDTVQSPLAGFLIAIEFFEDDIKLYHISGMMSVYLWEEISSQLQVNNVSVLLGT